MTMLAVTISKDGAVLSQDSWIYEVSGDYHARAAGLGVTRDTAESAASCYVGGGNPDSIVVLGQSLKILAVPRFRMAIAGTGSFRMLSGWYFNLSGVPTGDITALNEKTPAALRQLRDEWKIAEAAVIIHAGYSPARQAGCGFAYASSDDFEPQEIAIGETIAPAPDPNESDYAAIRELYEQANRGERIADLHAALMAQQRRAFLAGMLAAAMRSRSGRRHDQFDPNPEAR